MRRLGRFANLQQRQSGVGLDFDLWGRDVYNVDNNALLLLIQGWNGYWLQVFLG